MMEALAGVTMHSNLYLWLTAQAQASAEAAKAWAEMLSEMTAQAGSAGHVTV